MIQRISPNWSVPNNVHGFSTTRQGGVSQVPYESFNLGNHLGDNPEDVKTNRQLLVEKFGLPQLPIFLTQTHSTRVITLPYKGDNLDADAVYTNQPNQICLVMTADCLPVLFTNKQGTEVASAHAGWRGLCDGILEETIKCFQCPRNEIIAWFGPAIGPKAFQVGQDVVDQFVAKDTQAQDAFVNDTTRKGKFLGNLYQIARQRLDKMEVTHIYGGEHCTYTEAEQFFSFRRDVNTGRMATLIWFE